MSSTTIKFLALVRTLHIYLTIFALGALLFFAVTGFMLNHLSWFESDESVVSEVTSQIDAAHLAGPDRLAVVEALRAQCGITGVMDTFDTEDDELIVTFSAPGRWTEAIVDRQTGQATVTAEYSGIAVLLTDLHKAESTGTLGMIAVDAVAVFLALGAISGFVMLWSLPRRKKAALITTAIGLAVFVVIALIVAG